MKTKGSMVTAVGCSKVRKGTLLDASQTYKLRSRPAPETARLANPVQHQTLKKLNVFHNVQELQHSMLMKQFVTKFAPLQPK
jgi:hypothetical protein